MRITLIGRRAAASVAVAAVAASLSLAATPSAQAAPTVGTLTITPATGNQSSGLNAQLSTDCPAGSTGIVGYVTGPGITEQINGSAQSVLQSNRSLATNFAITGIFKDVFAANSIAAPSGTYTVRMACIGSDFFTEVGQFAQQVNFTATTGTNNANFVTVVPSQPTTTTLDAPAPANAAKSGTAVTLHASVSGGAAGTPTGSVQFKGGTSGSTNVGAPVALVAGAASLQTTALPAGSNVLKATYVPSGANALGASNSNTIAYAVAGPASITGTARVASTITCSSASVSAAGATKTIAWTVGTTTSSVVTSSVKVPTSWASKSVRCAAKVTKNGTTITQTSAAKTIAKGVFVATTAPKVTGTGSVGHTLTCSHGTWSPSPSTYGYRWYRGSTALSGRTASTYKTTSSDRGKYVTCQVTVSRTGYTSGVKKAPARKIS